MPKVKTAGDKVLPETSHRALNAHDLGEAGRQYRPLDRFRENPEYALASEAFLKAKATNNRAVLACMQAYSDLQTHGDDAELNAAETALQQAILTANETLPEAKQLYFTDRMMLVKAIRDFDMNLKAKETTTDQTDGETPATVIESPAKRVAVRGKKVLKIVDSGAIEGEEFDPDNFAHYVHRSENLRGLIKAYRACDVVTDPLQATNLEGMMREALELAGAPEEKIGKFVEMVREARTLDSIATPRSRTR